MTIYALKGYKGVENHQRCCRVAALVLRMSLNENTMKIHDGFFRIF